MERYSERPPRQNIFNIFEKGKDFFYLRTALTLIAIAFMLIGCFKLGTRAWSVYPVVIRDAYGNVSMGQGGKYIPNDVEVLRTTVVLLEALFTKTERGIATEQLRPYIYPGPDSEKLLKLLGTANSRAGYIQTANVFDFFFSGDNPKAALKVVNAQLDIVSSDFGNVAVDSAYVSVLMRRTEPTVDNPSGWRVVATNNLSRAQYFELRRKHVKDTLNDEPKMSELVSPAEFVN